MNKLTFGAITQGSSTAFEFQGPSGSEETVLAWINRILGIP
jgi:hypothetical protein